MSDQQNDSLASAIATKLIELEHEADSMTIEEVYERYHGYEWEVLEHRTGEGGVFTTANNGWSEKGVRHFLALLELNEFSFSEDDAHKSA